MMGRRDFLAGLAASAVCATRVGADAPARARLDDIDPRDDVFSYIRRLTGGFDAALYVQILGAANEFKEGDALVGVAAADASARANARRLLANTRLRDLDAHPPLRDALYTLIDGHRDPRAVSRSAGMTVGELRQFLLTGDEAAIKALMPGLSSDAIASVVKLMNNRELTAVAAKVFNPLPGSQIGARGFLGARIQPNSPTDNVDDIRWQVFDGWA